MAGRVAIVGNGPLISRGLYSRLCEPWTPGPSHVPEPPGRGRCRRGRSNLRRRGGCHRRRELTLGVVGLFEAIVVGEQGTVDIMWVYGTNYPAGASCSRAKVEVCSSERVSPSVGAVSKGEGGGW